MNIKHLRIFVSSFFSNWRSELESVSYALLINFIFSVLKPILLQPLEEVKVHEHLQFDSIAYYIIIYIILYSATI